MVNIVTTTSLSKHFEIYDIIVEALKEINLTVEEGDFITIYGPSGAGKTTLLNLIGALDKPTNGKIVVSTMTSEHMTKNF